MPYCIPGVAGERLTNFHFLIFCQSKKDRQLAGFKFEMHANPILGLRQHVFVCGFSIVFQPQNLY